MEAGQVRGPGRSTVDGFLWEERMEGWKDPEQQLRPHPKASAEHLVGTNLSGKQGA